MTAEPCYKCLTFLDRSQKHSQYRDDDAATREGCCPICLGLWNTEDLQRRLKHAIVQACEPYGGFVNAPGNRFSAINDPPVISLPGDIIFRYYMATKLSQFRTTKPKSTQDFVQEMKNHANEQMAICIEGLEKEQQQQPQYKDFQGKKDHPDFVIREEQGCLSFHIILTLPTTIPRPYLSNLSNQNTKRKKKKQYETQGGHPRANMERRLHLDDTVAALWPVNHAVEMTLKDKMKPLQDDWFVVPTSNNNNNNSKDDALSIKSIPVSHRNEAFQVRVALWRRPFLVKGNYTKNARDVSQSPFFIDGDNPKKRQRLGTTSIEELILPPLVDISGGIATFNNSPDGDNTVFGKAKFHASGREDMDVRMILPMITQNGSCNSEAMKNISGRPFCCEIIDALRMPTVRDLESMLHAINHTGQSMASGDQQSTILPESTQYYGRSPRGVGVDPKTLGFAKAEVFKNLQSETEEKHKFYGCLCWSEEVLPPSEELRRRLTTLASSSEEDGKTLFPLELHQRTPIRVLHRRANIVRIRHILSCHHVERLEDHYFRLHISTDAGTYVKEYCHGDLGRTQPNVSTLLGCGKIDILELDCEGIQIN